LLKLNSSCHNVGVMDNFNTKEHERDY
jgi:hypothetical protein